jgi:hypothetical protein
MALLVIEQGGVIITVSMHLRLNVSVRRFNRGVEVASSREYITISGNDS